MEGNYYNRNMKYIELKLFKCQNSTNSTVCKSNTAIDNYFTDEVFSFSFINTMFAIDDFNEPVKNFIDVQLFFNIDPNVSKRANLFV